MTKFGHRFMIRYACFSPNETANKSIVLQPDSTAGSHGSAPQKNAPINVPICDTVYRRASFKLVPPTCPALPRELREPPEPVCNGPKRPSGALPVEMRLGGGIELPGATEWSDTGHTGPSTARQWPPTSVYSSVRRHHSRRVVDRSCHRAVRLLAF